MKVELRFNDDQVKKSLVAAVKKHIRKTIELSVNVLYDAIRKRLASKVRKTPEYRSLCSEGGVLRVDLGIEEGKKSIESVINVLVNLIEIKINRSKNDSMDYIVPITITLFNNSIIRELIKSRDASYHSVNQKGKATLIPWLEWLLVSGDQPVVIGYRVFYGDSKHDVSTFSRTDRAIMVKGDGDNFVINSRFSGTKENNFIARACLDLEKDLEDIIRKTVIRRL